MRINLNTNAICWVIHTRNIIIPINVLLGLPCNNLTNAHIFNIFF